MDLHGRRTVSQSRITVTGFQISFIPQWGHHYLSKGTRGKYLGKWDGAISFNPIGCTQDFFPPPPYQTHTISFIPPSPYHTCPP